MRRRRGRRAARREPVRAIEPVERVRAAVIASWKNRVRHIEGHTLVELHGLLLAMTNLPDDELNVALVGHQPDDPLEALAVAEQMFRWRGRRFGIEIERGRHPEVERAISMLALDLAVERPAMAMDPAEAPAPALPAGVELRPVHDPEALGAAVAVNVEAFGMQPEVAERYLAASLLSDPRTRLYLGLLDGQTVACASTYLHEGTLGVFGVGTLERARRRGIGTAITAFAVSERRAEADLAWLHPTEMGRRMYEMMGFRPVSEWAVYVRTDPFP